MKGPRCSRNGHRWGQGATREGGRGLISDRAKMQQEWGQVGAGSEEGRARG